MREAEENNPYGGDIWVIECSGRRCYANGGILGLRPNPEVGEWPSEGYDGTFTPEHPDYAPPPFTLEERQEIANEMIVRWRQWAGNGVGAGEPDKSA